jgi:signal transduction histidine kinase
MTSLIFHPYVLTGYLTAITTLAIGFFVYLKNRKSQIHRTFLIFCVSITEWSFFSATQAFQDDPISALFWAKPSQIGAALIPLFFYFFTLKIIGKTCRVSLIFGVGISVGIIFLVLTTDLVISGMRNDVEVYSPKGGPLYPLMILFFTVYVLMGLFQLWKEVLISSGARRKHLQYFLIASIVGFVIGEINFFPVYGMMVWPYPYSAACGAIYASVIAYAILKHKLFNIEFIIKKGLVFALLFGSVYMTVSGFIFLVSYFLAKQSLPLFSGLSIALAMLIYEPLKAILTRMTNRFLFQKKTTYAELVQTLTEKLSQIKDTESIAGEITDFLTREMCLEWARLDIILNEVKDLRDSSAPRAFCASTFSPKGRIRPSSDREEPDVPLRKCASPQNDVIVKFIRRRTKPFILSPFDTENELTPKLKETLRREKIEALVPIFVERNLYGILLLGKKKSDEDFTGEDEALLKTLMDEVGMFFLSAKLLKEATRSGLELGQRMKMASVKKLARGVHHEVRNPLHAMDLTAETVLENLRKNRYSGLGTDGFALEIKMKTKDMLNNIDRIENSLGRFAQFARPEEDFELKALSLNEEVDKFLTLMREGQKLDKIKVRSSINGERILASEGIFQEILFNLFNNAFEAMHGTGNLFISIESTGEFVEMKFKDSGPGIPKEATANIFEPYFTTKQDSESVGIGLSIVKHHMERLGGEIEVLESSQGAEFKLKFRKADVIPAKAGIQRTD